MKALPSVTSLVVCFHSLMFLDDVAHWRWHILRLKPRSFSINYIYLYISKALTQPEVSGRISNSSGLHFGDPLLNPASVPAPRLSPPNTTEISAIDFPTGEPRARCLFPPLGRHVPQVHRR